MRVAESRHVAHYTPSRPPRGFPLHAAVSAIPFMHIFRRGRHGVNQFRLAIHTHMRLHAEIPLVAFLGLMHFRIPLLLAILG